MKNIFENAKFGDKFVTRNGGKAIFIKGEKKGYGFYYKLLVIDNYEEFIDDYYPDGKIIYTPANEELDIVSRYHEPIDFDKLHELANKLCPLEGFSNAEEGFIDEREDLEDSWVDGFKAGYRKAKEE